MAVFVPFVLPGERVEAEIRREKPGFARGSVTKLIEASPERIEAPCPYFRQCGGCHYQHLPYERQLQYKAEILRETLQRIAKIELKQEIQLHASPPLNYRNRTRLQVRTAPEFALGYFRFGSHNFLAVRECPISSPLINKVIAKMTEMSGLNCPAPIQEIELFANAEDTHLLAWAYCNQEIGREDLLRWAEALRHELPEIVGMTFFSSQQGLQDRSTGPRSKRDRLKSSKSKTASDDEWCPDPQTAAHAGETTIRYRTKQYEYRVSAGAFFQVNRYLIDELVSVVTGNAAGDIALDLYAGVGLFSAALARNFHHIFGVEASLTSHSDFVKNVPANVKAVGARAESYLSNDYLRSDRFRNGPLRKRPDLIVLDPPRSGVGKEVLSSLVKLAVPLVRYVSCDPSTLARDLVPLLAAGYRIEEAHLFDLFPQTFHIESVMLLAH
jgi:23S rRNA (uracil1939-C5)-methyltransferase